LGFVPGPSNVHPFEAARITRGWVAVCAWCSSGSSGSDSERESRKRSREKDDGESSKRKRSSSSSKRRKRSSSKKHSKESKKDGKKGKKVRAGKKDLASEPLRRVRVWRANSTPLDSTVGKTALEGISHIPQ
jgi:hypothetical protein